MKFDLCGVWAKWSGEPPIDGDANVTLLSLLPGPGQENNITKVAGRAVVLLLSQRNDSGLGWNTDTSPGEDKSLCSGGFAARLTGVAVV